MAETDLHQRSPPYSNYHCLEKLTGFRGTCTIVPGRGKVQGYTWDITFYLNDYTCTPKNSDVRPMMTPMAISPGFACP